MYGDHRSVPVAGALVALPPPPDESEMSCLLAWSACGSGDSARRGAVRMLMRVLLAGTPVLLAALFLLPSKAHAADRALVVGIETYANPDVPATDGCVRDAREIERFLIEKLGFSRDSVKVLVNGEATARNIEKEFRSWLIDGTQRGDRVFFHYAGHGSRIKRSDGDGDYHNTLAPYDVDPITGANQVLDVTIREMVNQLAGRRAVLLFDSCHSGSITRSLGPSTGGQRRLSGRYLPPPDVFARAREAATGTRSVGGFVVGEPAAAPTKRAARGMFLDTAMDGVTEGIVAISAAADDQVAYPVETEAGQLMGALTSSFLAASSVGKPTLGQVRKRIEERIHSLQQEGKLQGKQRPQFSIRAANPSGLESLPLFGTWETAAETSLQNPASSMRVSLSMSPKAPGMPYYEDETFAFAVESSAPGYVTVLLFSENRRATRLIPNQLDRATRIEAGRTVLPRKGEEFFVECTAAPCGREVAVAIVSEKPLPLEDKEEFTWDEVFRRLNMKELDRFLGTSAGTRGAAVRYPAGLFDWNAASVVFESRKKR